MRESWRVISEHPNYEVSNMGNVRNAITKKILKPYSDNRGYLKVKLDGVGRRVHILVARAFIPNEENKPIVNHKHSRRTDNRASQLEWVTASENTIHAWTEGKLRKRRKRVKQRAVAQAASL